MQEPFAVRISFSIINAQIPTPFLPLGCNTIGIGSARGVAEPSARASGCAPVPHRYPPATLFTPVILFPSLRSQYLPSVENLVGLHRPDIFRLQRHDGCSFSSSCNELNLPPEFTTFVSALIFLPVLFSPKNAGGIRTDGNDVSPNHMV